MTYNPINPVEKPNPVLYSRRTRDNVWRWKDHDLGMEPGSISKQTLTYKQAGRGSVKCQILRQRDQYALQV
jgi:hypothetical protein